MIILKLKFIRLIIAFTLIVGMYLPSDNAHLGKVEAANNWEDTVITDYPLYSTSNNETVLEINGDKKFVQRGIWDTGYHDSTNIELNLNYEPHKYYYRVYVNQGYAKVRNKEGILVQVNLGQYLDLPENFDYIAGKYGNYDWLRTRVTIQRLAKNTAPVISLSTNTNPTLSEGGTATLTGTVNDPDGDTVTISATVGGKAKSTTVVGSGTWSLSWSGAELAEGRYSNILITADDGKGGTASVTYTGTITVDKTKPTISVSPTQRSTWDTSIVNIAISLADNLSGVANRKYQLTNYSTPTGSWQTAASNSFNVSVNTEGEWYLHVSINDAAGNQTSVTYGPYRYFNLAAPSNIRFTDVTTTTLKLEWDTQSGHEYFVELQDKYNNIVKSSGWITAKEYSLTDLTPNAMYKPYIKSRKHGKESTNQLGPQQYTNAVPVTNASFEPQDKAIKVTLNIDQTGNDPDTEYIIKNMQTGQESPPVKKEWINDQLLNDMEYQYAAKVIHKNGKEGEWKLIGLGQTISTKIEAPEGWDGDLGDCTDLENGEFDPETIEGRTVCLQGDKAIVVKGRTVHLSASNVQNAKQYSISLTGYGYSDWKDLDATGSFTESIFINEPGLYKVHLKFKNTYGRESQPFVRNYLIDWVNPEVTTTAKIKGQTASTNGSFTVSATGTDNLSQIMYFNGTIWRKFTNNQDIALSVPINNQRNNVIYKFSDLNGNVVNSTHQVWGINK